MSASLQEQAKNHLSHLLRLESGLFDSHIPNPHIDNRHRQPHCLSPPSDLIQTYQTKPDHHLIPKLCFDLCWWRSLQIQDLHHRPRSRLQ